MPKSQSTPELRRIGAAIRDIRERRLERPTLIAERAGISVFWYRDIEAGRQPASRFTYLRIAGALGISADEMDTITGQEVSVS